MKKYFIFFTFYLTTFCFAQNFNNYVRDGLDYMKNEKYSLAVASFTKALELDSLNTEIIYQRGSAKFELKDFYGAIEDFQRTLKIDDSNQDYIFMAYYYLGLSYFNVGKFKYAISYYDRALSIRNDVSDIYFERGKTKINLGQIEDGCKDLSQAGQLGNSEAYDLIQKYCSSSKLYDNNVEWIKYGETIYFSTYYNPEFSKISDNIFQVVTKQILNDINYEEAKRYIFGQQAETIYKDLKYLVLYYSIDILANKIRKESINLYSFDNSLIEKLTFTDDYYKYKNIDGWEKPLKDTPLKNLIDIIKIRQNE